MKRASTNSWQRLAFYLLINVIVSACTTLAVLIVWDRTHTSPELEAALKWSATPVAGMRATPTAGVASATPASTMAAQEIQSELIRIDNIFGVGNLSDEVVVLKRVGSGELTLTDWKLTDSQGDTFTFPALTLYKDGGVQVHTAAGVNTVVDLYWGRDAAAWKTGDTLKLLDDQGRVRATYSIP